MSHKFIRRLLLGVAATALLAACAGATPPPAPTAEVIPPTAALMPPTAEVIPPSATATSAPAPQETAAPPPAAAADAGFSRTADGLFARGPADAPVTIYDYSDFL